MATSVSRESAGVVTIRRAAIVQARTSAAPSNRGAERRVRSRVVAIGGRHQTAEDSSADDKTACRSSRSHRIFRDAVRERCVPIRREGGEEGPHATGGRRGHLLAHWSRPELAAASDRAEDHLRRLLPRCAAAASECRSHHRPDLRAAHRDDRASPDAEHPGASTSWWTSWRRGGRWRRSCAGSIAPPRPVVRMRADALPCSRATTRRRTSAASRTWCSPRRSRCSRPATTSPGSPAMAPATASSHRPTRGSASNASPPGTGPSACSTSRSRCTHRACFGGRGARSAPPMSCMRTDSCFLASPVACLFARLRGKWSLCTDHAGLLRYRFWPGTLFLRVLFSDHRPTDRALRQSPDRLQRRHRTVDAQPVRRRRQGCSSCRIRSIRRGSVRTAPGEREAARCATRLGPAAACVVRRSLAAAQGHRRAAGGAGAGLAAGVLRPR